MELSVCLTFICSYVCLGAVRFRYYPDDSDPIKT
nr:MAG TPA: hypothetical protein [Inoviridae sp.]